MRVFFVCLLIAAGASAQEQWTWPEEPKNMQVLKDLKGQRLRPVMTGFTRALGVRCTYCHVGEEGKPLSTYDFVSDANPNKDRAREMLRMLGDINDHLKKIQPSGDKRVNMWCHTCHQGRPRPLTLEEDLGESYRKSGLSAALSRYRELKEKFYGKAGYHFSERSLNAFGYELLDKKDYDGAIAILTLNSTEFPKSANVWDSLAEAYMTAGKTDEARKYYKKSLDLDPKNKNAADKLKDLQ